jgi:hypothetical protein
VRLRLRTLAEHTEPTEQPPRAAAERTRLRSAQDTDDGGIASRHAPFLLR